MERKLASVQKIAEIKPIPDADLIVAYRVNGWWVVGKKNEFVVDDLAIYFEVDSWIPNELAPFLSKGKEPREYNNVKGERLRTIKLKGQISQGLLLPLDIVEIMGLNNTQTVYDYSDLNEGDDLTDFFGIQKWEAPIPAQLAGQVRGNFPSFLRKTDQERVQNLQDCTFPPYFEVTEKLHGASMTVYKKDGEYGVCSRNLDLKINEENSDNAFVKQFLAIKDQLDSVDLDNYAIQGELIGEGINGNQYGIKGTDFYVFDIFMIETQQYLPPARRRKTCASFGLKHVPVVHEELYMKRITVDELLEMAKFQSKLNGSVAEGLVFKNCDTEFSFKVISNDWLLKNE
jgi:RNA ligase (TIGR02306 family)